jgi:unsaturated chondroitin disaccharide hydrolase
VNFLIVDDEPMIAALVSQEEANMYRSHANRILTALAERYAVFDQTKEQILLEGTGHKPANQNVNVGLIYGDYFFVEAIAKCNQWKHRIF